MIVVADTSPLNYLILLGHSEFLPELFGRVLTPEAVLREMQHLDAPPEVSAWAASPPAWLERMPVKKLDPGLAAELGQGEREAISLALEQQADVLLIDELAGRREAEARHILVAGTLIILLEAGLRGHIDFPAEITRLRQLGFHVSRSLEAEMLASYAQKRHAR